MEDDSRSDCGTGWKALAELQYENRHYPEAYDTGGGWLGRERRRVAWCELAPSMGLFLNRRACSCCSLLTAPSLLGSSCAAVRGLRWLHSRRERGHEALTHVSGAS